MKKIILVITIFLSVISIYILYQSITEYDRSALLVQAVKAGRVQLVSRVSCSGKLEEAGKVNIFPDMEVEKVLIKEGQHVEKGQRLAVLKSSGLIKKLRQAKLDIQIKQLTLERLKAYKESEVQNTDSSITLYGQIPAGSMDMQGMLDQFLIIQKEVEMEKIQLKELEDKINKVKKGITSPVDGVVTFLKADGNEDNGDVSGINVGINPAMAVMGADNFSLGGLGLDKLSSGKSPLMTISDVSRFKARVEVNESDISRIRAGQEVEIAADALEGETLKGVVEDISPVAKTVQTGQGPETVVEIIVSINDGKKLLRPGYTIDAKIITGRRKSVVSIPFESVNIKRNDLKTVFIINKNNTIAEIPIETGMESETLLEVIKGLDGDEMVVTNPPSKLKTGSRVKIQR